MVFRKVLQSLHLFPIAYNFDTDIISLFVSKINYKGGGGHLSPT